MDTASNKPAAFPFVLTVLASLATIAIVWLTLDKSIPLGKVGEWVWNRAEPPLPSRLLIPAACMLGYLAVVAMGRAIVGASGWLAILALPMILVAGAAVQYTTIESANHGIDRWPFAVVGKGTSGYFELAIANPNLRKFMVEYQDWIAKQDNFHVGTHPPGLFVLNRWVIDYFESRPDVTNEVLARIPANFARSLAEVNSLSPLSSAQQAAVAGIVALTWFASLLTIIPIYLLARLGTSPSSALLAAALWPLVPASPMFLPLSDCLFPLLAATTILFALWSVETKLSFFASLAGIVCAIGTICSLAFLVVAALALFALVLSKIVSGKLTVPRLALHLIVFVAGFSLPCIYCYHKFQQKMILPVIWMTNAEKHAGFYAAMPRTYLSWIWLNLVEFAVVLGPSVFTIMLALIVRRKVWAQRTSLHVVFIATTLTLLGLNFSGKNLSEVARLWIFLTPLFCATTSLVAERIPSRTVAWLVFLLLQFVSFACLCTLVEPLLPIPLPA